MVKAGQCTPLWRSEQIPGFAAGVMADSTGLGRGLQVRKWVEQGCRCGMVIRS